MRAVVVKGSKYFGAACFDKEAVSKDGKTLARSIIYDPICGGALPGLGSITLLHLLKNKRMLPEIPEKRAPVHHAGRLNYCCAPMCVIGCLNRHGGSDGHIYTAPEEAEVRAAMAGCFENAFSQTELDTLAAALCCRGMELGLNSTEFVHAAAMYMEVTEQKPSVRLLRSLMEEIAKGSVTGRLLGGGTKRLCSLYRDKPDMQRRMTRPAVTKEREQVLALKKLCPGLEDMEDIELLYREIFLLENLGICIFSSFALLNKTDTMECLARLYSEKTGEQADAAKLLGYAGACLAQEDALRLQSAAAAKNRSIPEFVKVLYKYFERETELC